MKRRLVCFLAMAGLVLGFGTLPGRAITMPAPGLKVWLKADAIGGLNDADPVGVWPDSSGGGNDATNGGLLRPTWVTNGVNGRPVVRFNGLTNYLQNAAYVHGSNDASLFIVARRNGSPVSGYHNIFIGGPATFKSGTGSPGSFYQVYADAATTELRGNLVTIGALTSGVAFATSAFQLMTLWKASGASSNEFFINGLSKKTKTGTVAVGGKYYLGNWNNNPLNGDIAEVALYNQALGEADRQLVEGLMAWKYGLQAGLPASHPWKTVDPADVPSIETSPISSYSATNAVLSGYLTSGSYPLTVSIFWGPQDGGHPTNGLWSFTNTFAWEAGAYPATNVALPAPHADYYYRIYATNAFGESWAASSKSFFAADVYSWKQAAAGSHDWTNAANWTPESAPDAAYAVVMITNGRAGSQTIVVSGTNTLGALVIGNSNAVALTKLAGGAFRFDNGGRNPRLWNATTGSSLAADVVYGSASALEVSNEASLTISGSLGGFTNLLKRGAGTLALTSSANQFSGDLVIEGGEVNNGSTYSQVVPDTAIIEVRTGGSYKNSRSEIVKGFRGIGKITSTGGSSNGRMVIGTNTAGWMTLPYGYLYVVAGAVLDPGFGSTIGDLATGDNSAVNERVYIKNGDIYIDLASAASFDRIILGRSNGTLIEGGTLHLNFLGGYTPTNGTAWDIMTRLNAGAVQDPTPGDPLFSKIESNIEGRFVAEIVDSITVRVRRADLRGALIIVR